MPIIGLTGGIASGKSTVAAMLAEKGALVVDADRIARELVAPGKPAWQEIVDRWGHAVLLDDRSIDRKLLGCLVFNDAAARQELNEIIHPKVRQELVSRADALRSSQTEAVLVYDVPLLIEAGMHSECDLVLLVYVTAEVQLKRLQKRDRLSREEALLRIQAQMPLEDKKKYAHILIDNSGSLTDTARQVDCFWGMVARQGV